jgi:hypothetical protein
MKVQPAIRMVICLIASISFFFPLNSISAQGEAYYRFSPTAIYNNGQDSTTLEIYTGGNATTVTVKPEFADEPVYQLFDDGTNGDAIVGDGVYSLGGISTSMFPEDLIFPIQWDASGQNADLSTIWLSAVISYTSGQVITIGSIELRVLSPQVEYPAEQVGNGLFATEYAFFIVDPAGETYTGNFPNITDYDGQAIAKKFYSVYPDEFDFLNFTVVRGDLGMKAHAGVLQPPAQNIGYDNFDYTAEYGSQGRLLTMVYSGTHGGLLNHELGHSWGVEFGDAEGFANGAHWSGNSDIGGILSETFIFPDGIGRFIVSNRDGTYRALDWTDEVYAPLELYLMGMIHPEEVPDVHVLVNPDLYDMENITAERVDTYTIAEIVDLLGGPRDPAYPNAQTDFNLAYILLSDSDFSLAELSWYSYHARCYMANELCGEANFYTATGGLGTVNTRLADWGIPNIPSPTPTSASTKPPQPTDTTEPSQAIPTESTSDTVAQPTPDPRPEFKIPICNTLFTPAMIGMAWFFRRLFL